MKKIQNNSVAYFTMEVGINSQMHTYAGGLGILAGDTLKSAADLELNMVGVTLLSKKGYTKQAIDPEIGQINQEDPWEYQKHLKPRNEKVVIKLYGQDIVVGVWEYRIKGCTGYSIPIYFLDTDLPENSEEIRGLTNYLYDPRSDKLRIMQQAVLGIGGFEILKRLGYETFENYHLNESHAAFLILALNKQLNNWTQTQDHLCFTTHTPLKTAHQIISRREMQALLDETLYEQIPNTVWHNDEINLTTLSIIGSKYTNGVAKKHMEVTQEMYPGYKIEYVTNGIHTNTWVSPKMAEIFDKYLGDWRHKPSNLRLAQQIPLTEIQAAHEKSKQNFFDYLAREMDIHLDPKVLTLGFARRAVKYKRADFILEDVERLTKIAKANGGLQLIYAGKAHQSDSGGSKLIKNILQTAKQVDPKVIKIVYLPNYNMDIGKMITSGVDVWLNNPLPPLEASGTSGMKAALNAIPNFSILDGWWLEGWIEDVTGWAIGIKNCDHNACRSDELEDLYDKLENKIYPTFSDKTKWYTIGRNNISLNADHFNTDRMLFEYLTRAYTRQLM